MRRQSFTRSKIPGTHFCRYIQSLAVCCISMSDYSKRRLCTSFRKQNILNSHMIYVISQGRFYIEPSLHICDVAELLHSYCSISVRHGGTIVSVWVRHALCYLLTRNRVFLRATQISAIWTQSNCNYEWRIPTIKTWKVQRGSVTTQICTRPSWIVTWGRVTKHKGEI
jgi:hypothetical protein